jgi:lysophospholipase L1-like esterase
MVVDLNGIIAPEGVLLSKYSTDGVHFSNDGYKVWAQELIDILASQRR